MNGHCSTYWFTDYWDLIYAHNWGLICLLDGWWEDGYLYHWWNVVGMDANNA
jgi:hypothetical protein